MSIFNQETRTITAFTWTVDFDEFEKNPDATTINNLPEYLLPERITDEFYKLGYNIFIRMGLGYVKHGKVAFKTSREKGIPRVIITGNEKWNAGAEFSAGDGDTIIIEDDRISRVEHKKVV